MVSGGEEVGNNEHQTGFGKDHYMTAYQLQDIVSPIHNAVPPRELEYLAFTGQYEQVHAILHRIPPGERAKYANKYVLSQAIWGGIQKLRKLLGVHAESAAENEKVFIDETLHLFIADCKRSGIYPRELFQSILYWSDELVKLSLADEALFYIEEARALGINKFPDLQTMLVSRMAQIFSDRGQLPRAFAVLENLARRPFLLTDRNQIPEILFKLGQLALQNEDVQYYKYLMLWGLRHFYTDLDNRRRFVEQLGRTYRRSYRLFFDATVRVSDKILFFVHWFYYKMPDFRRLRLGFISQAMRLGILGYVYMLNYFRGSELFHSGAASIKSAPRPSSNGNGTLHGKAAHASPRQRRHILITRAMGGIGDLLMMTPGIHALKQKYPGQEIHLALPKRYFSVFQGNPDVILIDIENDAFDFTAYRKWFNLTDCPAARVESRTAPRVKKNRIEIFARSLGIRGLRWRFMNRRPRYFLSEEDKEFREKFWREKGLAGKTVIGVQLHADEVYRDYPHVEHLVRRLAQRYTVLVFDGKPINGCDFANVIKIDSLGIRQAFALASRCHAIIAPDSAFVHLAAALEVPCVALFGPIDGRVRTKDYPKCIYLDARATLNCVACWRNETVPCKLTNMRTSICMAHIPVARILEAIETQLQTNLQERHTHYLLAVP